MKESTSVSLKEHLEKLMEANDRRYTEVNAEKDKALAAALIAVKEENRKTELAAEKRFELLNELRSGVATKDQVANIEKVVDDLKTSRDTIAGKGIGMTQLVGIIGTAVALTGAIVGLVVKFL